MIIAQTAAVAAVVLTLGQFASLALAALRCRSRKAEPPSPSAQGISLVRPLKGIESHSRATLAAALEIAYPGYEVLFCVADAKDPVIPLVEEAMAKHPDVDARLLVGADRIGANPKLNNMVKGWREARYDWICFADSNLLTPKDYLTRIRAALSPGVGVVSAPPLGTEPEGFWGEFECAFLNTFEARWQYAVDALGMGFCQGKTLFLHRSLLRERGLSALADEPAEDAALTTVTRAQGHRVRLAAPPFAQPVGQRSASGVWSRQVRWARLRRATFPYHYAPEIVLGFFPAAIAFAIAAYGFDWPLATGLGVLFFAWFASEALLARLCGWPLTWRYMLASVLRDFTLPALWCAAWADDSFRWHGAELSTGDAPHHIDAR